MVEEEGRSQEDGGAEELLRRALLDDSSAVAVSLRVNGLPLSDALTVIFHGRRDLGTLQTYVTWGSRGAGATVSAGDLLRVPCDLDLADAEDRDDAGRAGRCRPRARRLARAAQRSLRQWRGDRSLGRSAGQAARATPAADGARDDRVPTCGDAGLQRADTRRRPPADRDRVRPAGPDARLSERRGTRQK